MKIIIEVRGGNVVNISSLNSDDDYNVDVEILDYDNKQAGDNRIRFETCNNISEQEYADLIEEFKK